MRRILISGFVASALGVLFLSASLSAASYHVYMTGYVASYGNNQLIVGKKRFILTPGVTVAFHDRRNGSYIVVKGKLSDVRVGQPVVVKAEGSSAYEILIERWKQ